MSDLVERLLKRKEFGLNGQTWIMLTVQDADCKEAAARVEALEAALRDCVAELSLCAKQLSARPDGSVSLALNKAIAALAPEKVKPVMAASEKAAEVVSGWSDAKKDYASRAIDTQLLQERIAEKNDRIEALEAALMAEMAARDNRIEALEAALRWITDLQYSTSAVAIARKALAPEPEK